MKRVIVFLFGILVVQMIWGINGGDLMKFDTKFQRDVGKIVQIDNMNGYLIEGIKYCSYKLRGKRKSVDCVIKINATNDSIKKRVLEFKFGRDELYLKISLWVIEGGEYLGYEYYYITPENVNLLDDIETIDEIIDFIDEESTINRTFLEP